MHLGRRRVVLIGYRAAGKTTAGRLAAERLGWSYLDVDRGIEARCRLTITEIFQRHGTSTATPRLAVCGPSATSRDVESSVVAELCAPRRRRGHLWRRHPHARPSTRSTPAEDGLLVMRPVNQEHARRGGLLVYLEADAEELWRRIEADPASAATRPNLAGGGMQEVVTMLARRAPVYRANADLTLDATLPPDELADRIVAAVRDRQRAGRR